MTDYAAKFQGYSIADMVGQLRLEAREKIDPEFEAFLSAVADRLECDAEIKFRLQSVLEPFAAMAADYDPPEPEVISLAWKAPVKIDHLRQAREALRAISSTAP
jgi:hypothetical protein